MTTPDWWTPNRTINVVVDNPSWIENYALKLVKTWLEAGYDANLCRSYDEIVQGGVSFFLGCTSIATAGTIAKSHYNLVVHESDLPAGSGFAPMTWQILEGRDTIPVCLIEAVDGPVDSGRIIYREEIACEGHELNDELRHAQGEMTVRLCRRFIDEDVPPLGEVQHGTSSQYPRRRPADSALDPERTLAEQFDLLRVVDNQRYPAFFDYREHRYKISIEKLATPKSEPQE